MLYLIDDTDPRAPFPPVSSAETDPDGLLAVGGDLSPERLLNAYRSGIFPWYSEGQPILWWSPNPRAVLMPDELKISRSLAKTLRNKPFSVTYDSDFTAVISACAEDRKNSPGTWITAEMERAYLQLHEIGYAHSVEVRYKGQLAGGLYGIAIGKAFFGESMFSRERDASKVALVHLCRRLKNHGYGLVDCQVASPHLTSLGAKDIQREAFCLQLQTLCADTTELGIWGRQELGNE